jgi:hypothetical protein
MAGPEGAQQEPFGAIRVKKKLIRGRLPVDVAPFPVIVLLGIIEAFLDPPLEDPDLRPSGVIADEVSKTGQFSKTGYLIIKCVHIPAACPFNPAGQDREI